MRALLFVSLALLAGCQCGGAAGAPVVRITSPAEGAQLWGTGPHLLTGEVSDPDETIPPQRIAWSSDRDGVVGQGTFTSASLSVGPHRLTLEAIDSQGQSGRAQISVVVLQNAGTDGGLPPPDGGGIDTPPVATITAPMNGAVFDQGQPIVLEGTAVDVPDGPLSGSALAWSSDRAGALGTGARVTFNNAALGTHRLVLTATDNTGNTGLASISFTVVPPGTNRAPTVTIAQPMPGAVLPLGTPAQLQGSATDPEDGALTGASLTWSSSVDGVLGPGAARTATLTQGVHVLTLTALDSMGGTGSASVTVSVNQPNNQAPTATITAPTTTQTIFQGTPVQLAGTGTDPEDGALPASALSWSSSLDGALGTGSPFTAAALSVGDHTITLVARDSGGNTGTASVRVVVLPANQAPAVSISAPATGTSVPSGSMVTLVGTASDPEDGALSGAALRWSSSRDGVLGTGSPLSTSGLSVGSHTLTLTATDSGGRTGSASIALTVTMSTANVPPIARLTGPTTGQATQALTFDGAGSSDADGTIVGWRFDFGDGSTPVGGAQAQRTHTYAAPGVYTVTLTVTDDRGATASATLQVTVTAFVRVPVVAIATVSDVGRACAIATPTPGARVFVAWTTTMHPGVHFGEWVNGALQAEVVDGLGFNTGGSVRQHVALEVTSAGTPHLVYVKDGQLWYATRVNGAWVRERADAPGLALAQSFENGGGEARSNPSFALNGQGQPVVLYPTGVAYSSTNRLRPALATRSAAGTWTQGSALPATVSGSYAQLPTGQVVFEAPDRFLFPLHVYDGTTGAFSMALVRWSGTAGTTLPLGNIDGRASLALRGTRAYLLGSSGVWDIALSPTLSSSTARRSLIETFSTTQHGVAFDAAGLPRGVVNHGGELESIWAGPDGFWRRFELGDADPGLIGVSVDAADQTRACFVRAGKLMLY